MASGVINILVSFLSLVRVDKETKKIRSVLYSELDAKDGQGAVDYTNESGLRFVMQQLMEVGERLDYYLPLVSAEVMGKDAKDNISFLQGDEKRTLSSYAYILERTDKIFKSDYFAALYGNCKVEDFYKSVDYDVKASKDDSVATVLKAIDSIKKLEPDKELHLHLDLSGGPRDANMRILIITRLLTADPRVKVATVLYSNMNFNAESVSVELVTKDFKLLDLVSGVQEFINYGKVTILEEYFMSSPSNPVINALLYAMKDFSEKIEVCHYGELKKAIMTLQQAITDLKSFLKHSSVLDKNLEPVLRLWSTLSDEIEKKYQPLFPDGEKGSYDLQVIEWCYKNGYYQQAMTLITELVPHMLFVGDNPILELSEACHTKADKKYNEEKDKRIKNKEAILDFHFWLFAFYNEGVDENSKSKKPQIDPLLVDLFRSYNKKSCSKTFENVKLELQKDFYCFEGDRTAAEVQTSIKDMLEILKAKGTVSALKDYPSCDFIYKYLISRNYQDQEMLFSAMQKLSSKLKINTKEDKLQILQEIIINKSVLKDKLEKLLKELSYIESVTDKDKAENNAEETLKSFEKTLPECAKNLDSLNKVYREKIKDTPLSEMFGIYIYNPYEKLGSYKFMKYLLDKKKILSRLGTERADEIIKAYFEIKMERNASNHAHEGDENNSYSSIQQMLGKLIRLLKTN